jgi:hypothetical protein
MRSKKVYLITKSGPEWQKPVEVWPTKKQADVRAKELNNQLDTFNVLDRLSHYQVIPVPMRGETK